MVTQLGYSLGAVEPSLDLVEAIKNICEKDVREEALSVLYDEKCKIDIRGDLWEVALPGLGGPARVAMLYWESPRPKLKSPTALKTEFEELGASMREVAGRLRMLSDTAKYFISMMPDYDMASDECRHQMDLWEEFDASEAFRSPFLGDETQPKLASRLDGMAKMLDSMASEAKRIAEKNPGARHVFNPHPVDLELFHRCSKVLVKRGKTLKYLRPIAEALYTFATGEVPAAYWGKRQEDEARKKFETYPHKQE